MDQEIVDIQDLDGVGPVTAGKLREAGYDSILAIAIAPIRELTEKASLESSTACKIVKAARRQIDTGFITAKQLYDKRQYLLRLTLLSKFPDGKVGVLAPTCPLLNGSDGTPT